MTKSKPLGIGVDDRYRNIPEARIVQAIMLVGWAHEVEWPAAAAGATNALQGWIRLGLPFRTAPDGERLFDPIEVNNFMKCVYLEGRDDFWVKRYIHTGRRLILNLAETGPSNISKGEERRFVIDFRRTYNLGWAVRGSQLRLRAPLPLEGNYVRNLQVAPLAESRRDAQVSVQPGRLEVRMVSSGETEVVIGSKMSFSILPQKQGPGPVDEEPEKSLYLRHREGLIVISQRISALAESLAEKGAPSIEIVRAFWEFMNRELIFGGIHYDQVDYASPCDWVLDTGWYDCQLGSALFVALCRARGIPARLIGGYLLYPEAPGNHYWAEVWLEDQGWTPYDLFSLDLSPDGKETAWRDCFFGRIDCRLISDCLPKQFTGALGVPIPPAWCVIRTLGPEGSQITLMDIDGTPVYTDRVRITAT